MERKKVFLIGLHDRVAEMMEVNANADGVGVFEMNGQSMNVDFLGGQLRQDTKLITGRNRPLRKRGRAGLRLG